MQIHELPEITTITSGGYFATDNGTQTTKIDYDKLAKAIIENYASSTLAGSAQSVKAALDGIKAASVLTRGTSETVTASTDVNDYVTPGTYFFNSGTKALNAPNNSGYFRLEVVAPTGSLTGTNSVRYQRALTSEGVTYTRLLNSADSGSTWTAQDWIPDPGFNSADRLIISANSDLNTFTTPGAYRSTESAVTATLTNCPVTSYGFNLDVVQLGVRHFVYQRLIHYTGSVATAVINEYYRFINVRDSIVGAWTKVPTREEVDALSGNMASITFTRMIATTSGTTATLPNNYRGTLKTIDSSADRCGLYFVRTESNGRVNCTPVREATALTIDSSTANKLIVTSPGSSVCIFENISGTATV